MRHLTLETKSAAPAKAPPPARERANDRETKHLPVPFALKAVDSEERTAEGMLSTWDLDMGGDLIHRGAFKRTLQFWEQSGRILPLLDNHNSHSTRDVIGKLLDAKETKEGLWTRWKIVDGPDGDAILDRLKGGFVDGLSIGYRPVKIEMPSEEEERAGVWRHLKEVELREGSIVIWPMNEAARIDLESVKSLSEAAQALMEAAVDRELSDTERAELKSLQDKIGELLAPQNDDEEEAAGEPAAALASDDPKRLDLEARLRRMRLIRLEREGRRAS